MNEDFFLAVGGIGMFLLGMKIMTNALREAAGSNLRDWLSRFTDLSPKFPPAFGESLGVV